MSRRWRTALGSLAVIALSTALALLAADWIAAEALKSPGERAAQRIGMSWDSRDRLDVVSEARASEPNWFPAVPANTYLERPLLVGGARVVPLGGVANAKVVGCNESGYFSTFTTDEFGFNNPPGALLVQRRKIFFVGDSFTQGDCLRQGETIVDRVRARHTGTVNLGSGGNGPLFQLAAIREYIRAGEAAAVVWMYYEGNDLQDLRRDRADPVLARYLEPAFSQRLLARQQQINDAVRDMVEERMAERLRGRPVVLPNLRLLFWNARQGEWFQARTRPGNAPPAGSTDRDLALFLDVVATAQREVEAKGARFLFAYLPEYYRYAGPHLSASAARRDAVLAAVGSLGIQIVDLHEAFRQHPDPVSLFPFGLKGHYNSDGAALVATALLEALGQP